MRKYPITAISLLFCLSAARPATATENSIEEPLWELGFGAGSIYAPDYPGSSEHHFRSLALPYVIYRGDVLRIGDGQTARAVAFENNRLELDLSFAAAFDADSEDNVLRRGMPDLDFMFQLGPQLTVNLGEAQHGDGSRSDLSLALQARAVFSSDLRRIDDRGFVFEPMLRYRYMGWLSPRLDLTLSLRPQWASQELHSYFYDVSPEFVTARRPEYRARQGYFGTGLNVYGDYRVNEQVRAFVGLQTTSHHGAANRSSPLHEKDFTAGFIAGFVWTFMRSDTKVPRP